MNTTVDFYAVAFLVRHGPLGSTVHLQVVDCQAAQAKAREGGLGTNSSDNNSFGIPCSFEVLDSEPVGGYTCVAQNRRLHWVPRTVQDVTLTNRCLELIHGRSSCGN